MKSIIGIALEQFEYNERWKIAVIFLTFFSLSTISLQFLVTPKIELSAEHGQATIDLISDKLNLSEDSENKAKSIFDTITNKLSNTKGDDKLKDSISSSVDDNQEQVDHIQSEPTTLDTLNED